MTSKKFWQISQKAEIDENDDLIITLTDGTIINCGKIDGFEDGSGTTPPTTTPDPDIYKRDEDGNLFNGFDEDGKFYQGGLVYSGIRVFDGALSKVENGVVTTYTGIYENVLYVNGAMFNGSQSNKIYVNGTLVEGVYTDGKLYQAGLLFTGNANGKYYVSGVA